MTFEELKEKAEKRFERELADKEIAEIAIEQLDVAVENEMAQNESINEMYKELSELKANKRYADGMTDLERTVSERICEILSVPCDVCEVSVVKDRDGVRMNFSVYNHTLVDNTTATKAASE